MNNLICIAITSGDLDGIGAEVTAKALCYLKPVEGVIFYLWRHPSCPQEHLDLIDKYFIRHKVSSWEQALQCNKSSYTHLIDVCVNSSPAFWVERSVHAAQKGQIGGLVTGPLSKKTIKEAGYNSLGHTQLFKSMLKKEDIFMFFAGDFFNVLLLTEHIPLSQVAKNLNQKILEQALKQAIAFRPFLPLEQRSKPIAFVGLNPHAGEEGLLGQEEKMIFKDVILKYKKQKNIPLAGPLVPDVAYEASQWNRYCMYLSPYHDQGLIPFKMAHKKVGGVHVSLGLPFVRTSVDHGTAKDIFGQNKAQFQSMTHALKWAIKLCLKQDSG